MGLEAQVTAVDGTVLGDVRDADVIGVNRGIKRTGTARFTVDAGNELRAELRQTAKRRLKVYDVDDAGTRTLVHHGQITAFHRRGQEERATIEVGSSDPSWRFATSLYTGGATFDVPKSRSEWLEGAAGSVNDSILGYVGSDGTVPLTPIPGRNWRYQPVALIVSEICTGLDGPEWKVNAIEPTIVAFGEYRIGVMAISAAFGVSRPGVVFEYAAGRGNVSAYDEMIDATILGNRFYNFTAQDESGSPTDLIIVESNAAAAEWGRYSHVITADLTDVALRTALLNDHLAIRQAPRQVVQFTVAVDPAPGAIDSERTIYRPGVDYDIGDVVTFRAVEPIEQRLPDGQVTGHLDEVVIDGLFRIRSIDIADDAAGRRTTTLIVIAE